MTVTNRNLPISEPKSTGLIDAGKASDMVDVVLTAALSRTTITAKRPPVAQGRKYFPISEDQILKDLEELNNTNNINNGSCGWVDSMRASSPTHLRSISSSVDMGNQHNPSALDMFEQIITASKGKQIVMFLDYDGTLSPIVDDPDRAFMSEAMRTTVRKVARYFPTAIVSGRCRDKVYNFVRLAELFYAGSHGMDIMGPAKKGSNHFKGVNINNHQETVLFQPAGDLLPMIDQVQNTLIERIKSIPGVKIENNKFCLSVHFRCVDEKKWSDLAHEVRSVLKDYPKLRLTQGRKVLEIRPSIKWDKGKALEFLLESLGLGNCTNVFPVYIGDDRTDEDAFKVLRDREQGFGILVSKIPKETNASYYLQEPAEVMDFLQRLVKWKRLSMRKQFRL